MIDCRRNCGKTWPWTAAGKVPTGSLHVSFDSNGALMWQKDSTCKLPHDLLVPYRSNNLLYQNLLVWCCMVQIESKRETNKRTNIIHHHEGNLGCQSYLSFPRLEWSFVPRCGVLGHMVRMDAHDRLWTGLYTCHATLECPPPSLVGSATTITIITRGRETSQHPQESSSSSCRKGGGGEDGQDEETL